MTTPTTSPAHDPNAFLRRLRWLRMMRESGLYIPCGRCGSDADASSVEEHGEPICLDCLADE